MLLSKEKITEALVENLLCWPHSGFHVHQGGRIESNDKAERERVAGYILRAPLSQEKMRYLEEKDQVIYQSGKKGSEKKVFTALDWLAALTAHIPNRGEQMVRYYGWYSNKSRGIRKEATQEICYTFGLKLVGELPVIKVLTNPAFFGKKNTNSARFFNKEERGTVIVPIYEYFCRTCRKSFSKLWHTIAASEGACCPYCNSNDLNRLISRVAIIKSEERRLESLADPSKFGDLDESDPRSYGRLMRKMAQEMGEDMGEEFGEMVDRLEAGESPEDIERTLGEPAADYNSMGLDE